MAKAPVGPTLKAVQEIISEVTGGGYEALDIHPHFHLEEDLQIDLEIDFPKLVKKVNQVFHTTFTAAELLAEGETVADLVEIIDVETELG